MTLIAVAAAKSSPGTSTVAELLAQLGPPARRAVLLDCDPAGGDWLLRPGVAPEPGLASLAVAGRRGLGPGELVNHLQHLGDGLGVLVAPAAGRQAASALEMLGEALVDHLRALQDLDVVIDCGVLSPASPALPLAVGADLLVMVSRATARAMVHLAPLVERFLAEAVAVAVVLVRHGSSAKAEATYCPAEVAEALGVEVLGPLDDDPGAAARLYAEPGRVARLARTALVGSAAPVAQAIFARATQRQVEPPASTTPAPATPAPAPAPAR